MRTEQRNQIWINQITQCAKNATIAHKVNPLKEFWFVAQDSLEQEVRNIERIAFPNTRSMTY